MMKVPAMLIFLCTVFFKIGVSKKIVKREMTNQRCGTGPLNGTKKAFKMYITFKPTPCSNILEGRHNLKANVNKLRNKNGISNLFTLLPIKSL